MEGQEIRQEKRAVNGGCCFQIINIFGHIQAIGGNADEQIRIGGMHGPV